MKILQIIGLFGILILSAAIVLFSDEDDKR